MHCKYCDHILTDEEEVFKYPGSNTYADECKRCYLNLITDLGELGMGNIDIAIEAFINEDRE